MISHPTNKKKIDIKQEQGCEAIANTLLEVEVNW